MIDQEKLVIGFLWFVAFLFSTTVHEAMHALAALRGGDPTAYHGGQVTLSPIPHIKREPIGMLVVPLLTALTQGWAIGWASTPYDPYWAARYPKRAALMAAAGPAGNLAVAFVAFVVIKIGLASGWFIPPDTVNFNQPRELGLGGSHVCRRDPVDLPDAERAPVRVQPDPAPAARRRVRDCHLPADERRGETAGAQSQPDVSDRGSARWRGACFP